MRKTKIVCTLGPATDDKQIIKDMILAGMNVARLNFSHGTYEDMKNKIDIIKSVRKELNVFLPILLDTKGPEIRIRNFKNSKATLVVGQTFTLTADDADGDEKGISITFPTLHKNLQRGDHVLIADGLIDMVVDSIKGTDIVCSVINGGTLTNRKSINIPGVIVDMPYMSDVDKNDILFGIEQDVDIIAASFARRASDIQEMRHFLHSNNGDSIEIIAKIENEEGVDNINEIMKASDGIMVARGDLGVEIPFEDLPKIQKSLIKKCYSMGKRVITATQMLESMITNTRPTRAEVSDVANAVYDDTSAVMLSGETAVGHDPVEAVRVMARIAEKAEHDNNYEARFEKAEFKTSGVTDAISHATCTTAHDLKAAAIIVVTQSGITARMVSKFRPNVPIVALSTSEKVCRQLNLSWGIYPVLSTEQKDTDSLFDHAVKMTKKANLVEDGDLVVITGGVPVGVSGTTNILKVQIVGDILVQGVGVNALSACGTLCICHTDADVHQKFESGQILVVKTTSNSILSEMKAARAIIVEEEGLDCHAAIVGMTLEIPVITGAHNATRLLKNGTSASIDSVKGLVYSDKKSKN